VLTAEGAGVVADSSSFMDSPESLGGRMMVAGVHQADLQNFVECDGIAFIDVCHKFAVGALVAR
jgi:hypothetical protein